MKIDLKKLLIKYLVPSFLLISLLKVHTYITTGILVPVQTSTIGLFFVALLFMFVFWALLEHFQNVTGMLMKESWVSRIIFILIALVLFYIYKINGRI
ncbi:MAG: hypothetical protein ACRCX7_08870 [Cetobacterium sp.]|uniref:hypothetical protein n=1 Tax=Cetobacterium sp. TaxID=2071632 RepID=UPI003EE45CB6